MASAPPVLLINEHTVKELLSVPECIDVMADALAQLTRGEARQPLRTVCTANQPASFFALMPAMGPRSFGVKTISVFPANTQRGLDSHQGVVTLYAGDTGLLLALINAAPVTAIRTAAVSGLSARIMASPASSTLAIIGAGVQARTHLQAMMAVRPSLRCLRIASRTLDSSNKLAAEATAQFPALKVAVCASVESAVREADIVCLVTGATDPVLKREWVKRGAHLVLVGACRPNWREVDSATMRDCYLVVDNRTAALNEAGDLIIPHKEGVIPDASAHIQAELGDLVIRSADRSAWAEAPFTAFKSLGLAVEDLACAELLYHKAKHDGKGSVVHL